MAGELLALTAAGAIIDTVKKAQKKIVGFFDAGPYDSAIKEAASQYGIPPILLNRQLYKESRFNPKAVNSVTGAKGIAQFMDNTLSQVGLSDPFDAEKSIDAAAFYLRQLYDKFGSWPKAFAAYNWGPGNVLRKGLQRAPKETRDYVKFITGVTL